MQKFKLLVVEDDPNLGTILAEYLRAKEYDVKLCVDGEEGFDYGIRSCQQAHYCERWRASTGRQVEDMPNCLSQCTGNEHALCNHYNVVNTKTVFRLASSFSITTPSLAPLAPPPRPPRETAQGNQITRGRTISR